MDEVRRGKIEALFRDVNERIAQSAERFQSPDAEFVCECSDQTCTERVAATLDTYEEVRQDGTHFLLKPGHEHPDIEKVIERRPRYEIVKKVNAVVAQTVRQLNPRPEPA